MILMVKMQLKLLVSFHSVDQILQIFIEIKNHNVSPDKPKNLKNY